MGKELVELLGTGVNVNNIKRENDILIGKCNLEGKELIAYIIGNIENDGKMHGKIIGMMVDEETGEERIAVSNENRKIYQLEIKECLKKIKELEKFRFRSLYERSAGAIIYKIENGETKFLIVYSLNGFWGFPKGHLEFGETDEQAAIREVEEEVGIKIKIQKGFKEEISYIIGGTPINKEVCFFLSKINANEKVKIDENELLEYKFVTIAEAEELLNDNVISVLKKVKIKV